jgi:hypothetical protein
MDWTELRSWLQLVVVVVAAAIGFRTYAANQRQRRLENSMRLADWFHRSLRDGDLEEWKFLLYASCDAPGKPHNFFQGGTFKGRDGEPYRFADLFHRADSPDKGTLNRMADLLNFICCQCLAGAADSRFIYFELGQLLQTVHLWASTVNMTDLGWPKSASFVAVCYPHLHKFVSGREKVHRFWPGKTHAYID